jgi:hypothetical protein
MITPRSVIVSILIVAALFAVPIAVHSYDLNDLSRDTSGLILPIDQCNSVNIGNLVNNFQNDVNRDWLQAAKDEFQRSFQNFPQQWIMCIVGSLMHFGTGVSGAKSCATTVGDATLSSLKRQYIDKYKNDIVTDCNAQTDVRDSINAARQVLAENGREGGAAYVTDWRAFQADNSYRGLQIARNEMANTKHCPWVSGELQAMFNYDPSKAVTPQSGNEDGQNSYIQDAACSLPDDFNPGSPKYQTLDSFAALMEPQNYIGGAYLMAQEEVDRQVTDEQQAAQNEFANTGGFGALREQNPTTGNSCAVMAADGSTCLQFTKIVQPAGGVVAEVNAERQALYDLVTNPRTTQEVPNDVTRNLVSSFMSLNQPLARLQYTRGGSAARGGATPTPTPSPTNVPGSGDPGDPVCTGGVPDCTCMINDNQSQQIARGAVLAATRAAIAAHPEMVTPDGVSVLPGMNVPFLQAVCAAAELSSLGDCRANNAAFGIVISTEPIEMNVDVLTASNVIRQPGQLTTVCTTPGNL